MNQTYDAVVIGTGAAGLFCALNLPKTYKICVITKQKADESDSFLAQGGICMLRGEEDYLSYFEDTMRAGHYENNEDTVEVMIRSSNTIIRELLRMGVDFCRTSTGALDYTREGAHSQPRILYHEDVTGREITSVLLKNAEKQDNVWAAWWWPMRQESCGALLLPMWCLPAEESVDCSPIPQTSPISPEMPLLLL